MKKLVLFVCLLAFNINMFGQNIFNFTVRARGGIIVGLDGIKIDSITTSNDTLSFWHGGSQLYQKGDNYPSAGIVSSTGSAWGTSIATTGTGNVVLSASPTLSGTVTLGTGSITMTGSIATTSNRVIKVWATDIESTNLPTVNGGTLKTALSLTSSDVGLSNVTNKAQVEVEDSLAMLANYILDSEARTAINDTATQYLNDAVLGVAYQDYEGGSTGNDYYMTPDQVRSEIVASGGGLNGQILKFIIGTTTGAPTTADSTVAHSEFAGKHVDLYRNGCLQYLHTGAVNTLDSTYRQSGNSLYVKPLWKDTERVEIRILDPIAWSDLSLEGEESTLLTGISAYWKLDETSGSVATDATGTQDATVSGSPSRVVGKLGYAVKFNDPAHVMAVETPVTALDLDTAFSVSFWLKLDSMPSASTRTASYIMNGANLTTPTSSQRIYIPGLAGYIDNPIFRSANTADVIYQVTPDDAGLSDSTWYHIVVLQRGHSDTLYMYVNNVRYNLTSGAGGIFSGTVGGTDDALRFGNSVAGAAYYLDGYLDEIAIWKRELTDAEVEELYNSGLGKTYPFN